jgi:hypothetical protein
MKQLVVSWQTDKCWYPIGKVDYNKQSFRFFYLKGAQSAFEECHFQPLIAFPDFNHVYESVEIFPWLDNRILSHKRPEFKRYLQWLQLDFENADEFAILAKSGGRRATDTFELFAIPTLSTNSCFQMEFFLTGISALSKASKKRIAQLHLDEPLFLRQDCQNAADEMAFKTQDQILVGFCPKYFSSLLSESIHHKREAVIAKVQKVNPVPAPMEFRLLCQVEVQLPKGKNPFSKEIYEPII